MLAILAPKVRGEVSPLLKITAYQALLKWESDRQDGAGLSGVKTIQPE